MLFMVDAHYTIAKACDPIKGNVGKLKYNLVLLGISYYEY